MSNAIKSDRRTQEERADAMRARLLQATLEQIAEEGWNQTSTQKICKRAGVSRGAQTHHFPTKESLLLAAVSEIVARYQRELDSTTIDSGVDGRQLEKLFDTLWDACFEGNLLTCWLEVMVAARTDQSMRPEIQRTDTNALEAMRGLGEKAAPNSGATGISSGDLVELTVYLLRGMVVQGGIHPGNKERLRLFKVWKTLVLAAR